MSAKDPKPWFTYQSMGAGVQSTAIALLMANGVIPKPAYAVFADPGWESRRTYAHLEKLNNEVLRPSGIMLVRLTVGNIRDSLVNPSYRIPIPLNLLSASGKRHISERACTREFKIEPINKWVRKKLGAKATVRTCKSCLGTGHQRDDAICRLCLGQGENEYVSRPRTGAWVKAYIGFSSDEIGRVGARWSTPYVENNYPLIDGDLSMSRDDCLDYCSENGWKEVHKSSCIGCPYHSNYEWRAIKEDPVDWQDAVEVDAAVRNRLQHQGFLHHQRVPLPLADLSRPGRKKNSCSPYGCVNEEVE